MGIDAIIAGLTTHYPQDVADWNDPRMRRLTELDIQNWIIDSALPRNAVYDGIARELAIGFHCATFSFDFCDAIVNHLFCAQTVAHEEIPQLFQDVFLAFDAGEFYPNGDRSIDPIDKFTRPLIAEIVARLNQSERSLDERSDIRDS